MTRSNKRKCRNKREKSPIKDDNSVAEEERFGPNDLISRLPYLCLINIFQHLSRMDIFNMTLVNHRMWPIADARSLDHIKWRAGWGGLSIFQIPNGYAFNMDTSHDYDNTKHDIRNDIYCQYEVTNEDGVICERRIGGNNIEEDFEMEEEYVRPTLDDKFDRIPYHSWPVPNQLYGVLKERLRHRAVKDLSIVLIPIKALFFSNIISALEGQSFETLWYAPIKGEEVASVDRRSYLAFLKRFESIKFYGHNINEQMIRELSGSRVRCLASNLCDVAENLSELFRPDESIIPYIVSFHRLEVPTMELKAIWAVKLVMLYINTMDTTPNKVLSVLEFCVDEEITDAILANTLTAEYEYSIDDERPWNFTIIRTTDKRQADIIQRDYELEGEVIDTVIIRFSHEDQ